MLTRRDIKDLNKGRDFHELETNTGGDPVVIMNQTFARRYLPGEDAIGRRIRWGPADSPLPWMTVVGVVPDMHVSGEPGRTPQRLLNSPLSRGVQTGVETHKVCAQLLGEPKVGSVIDGQSGRSGQFHKGF